VGYLFDKEVKNNFVSNIEKKKKKKKKKEFKKLLKML
jgi:hypothetical protein